MEGHKSDYPFRVAALRELFEETGILFVTDRRSKKRVVLTTVKDGKLDGWRRKIRANPSKFSELFTDFNLDLEALKPWSNWLTPVTFKHRYDTLFFVIPVDDEIEVQMCDKEMSEWLWITPREILERNCQSETGLLPPPQYCELMRLLNTRFNRLSAMCNPHRLCPQVIFSKENPDKIYEVLPGDNLYIPENAAHVRPRTMSEADISKSEVTDAIIHRMTYYEPSFFKLQLHIKNVDKDPERIRLFHIERTVC
ncbi:hypothetical protein L596_017269 [Steinernema carpocapsae]|nr:hypothetical protein L596_017269 [Steinernema carpocapsae]